MSKLSAWAFESVVTAAVVCGLIYVADFRYAVPLVYPAPTPPDYVLQATIAYIGVVLVLILAVLLTLSLTRRRRPRPRLSSVVGVAAIVVASGIGVVVVAMVVSAA